MLTFISAPWTSTVSRNRLLTISKLPDVHFGVGQQALVDGTFAQKETIGVLAVAVVSWPVASQRGKEP